MATLIHPGGGIEAVEPANGKDFTLDELQGFVGGSIQIVYPRPDPRRGKPQGITVPKNPILVINEEGKYETPTTNIKATILMGLNLIEGDWIAGPALLCESREVH